MTLQTVETKFAVASKAEGCSKCSQLEMFLNLALGGQHNDDITFAKQEVDIELYDEIKDKTGAMSLPIILNCETGEHISGFDPSALVAFLDK